MNRIAISYCLGACVLVMISACAPTKIVLSPYGDTAKIVTTGNLDAEMELVAITDTSFIFSRIASLTYQRGSSTSPALVELPFGSTQSIEILGYSNEKWKTATLVFGLLPSLLLGVSASAAGNSAGESLVLVGVMAIPLLLSSALLSSGTPKPPNLTIPFSPADAAELGLYARYPMGIEGNQLRQLLARSGQEALQRLSDQ